MRIDLSNVRNISKSDLKKIDNLKQGDVIKARIVDVSGDTVKIDIGNGEIVEGKLDVPLDLAKGKLLNFVIKDVKEGTILISPVYEDVDVSSDFVLKNKNLIMDRILNLSNLSKDDKNLSIIKNMISYKMPLKPEDIGAISKYTDKLVSLLNLNEGDTLKTLLNSDPLDVDINKLIKTEEDTEVPKDIKTNTDVKSAKENTELSNAEKNNSFKEASIEFLNKGRESLGSNKSELENPIKDTVPSTLDGKKIVLDDDKLLEALKNTLSVSDSENIEGENIKLKSDMNKVDQNNKITNDKNDFKELSNIIRNTDLNIDDSSELGLKDILKNFDMEMETGKKLELKDITDQIKTELKENFSNDTKVTDIIQKLTFLVKSDVEVTVNNLSRLSKFLEQNQVLNKDLVEVLELASKEGIIDEKTKFELLNKVKTLDLKFDGTDSEKLKAFQSEIKEALEKLLTEITKSTKPSEELNAKAKYLNDDIDFFNKINDKNTMMLIPFTMNNKEIENGLYVLSKRKTSRKTDNIRVYMNLNTVNLESVKIFCDFSYDRFNINFKVKEDYVNLFERGKQELQTILESKGYDNTFIYVNKEEEENILDIISHDDTINYMLNIKV